MIGRELASEAAGWRRWLYGTVGTLDVDEWIWYWHYRKFFFPLLGHLRTARVLDAGCGKGLWSFYLARGFACSHVTGIDLRAETISFCQRVKRAESIGNAQFEVLAFDDISFQDEFDVVLSFNSLHYSYRNDVEILMRFADALKPGGLLMLAVPVASSLSKGRSQYSALDSSKADLYGTTVDVEEFLDHYYPEDLSRKLASSGFELVDMRRVVGRWGQLAKRMYSLAAGYYLLKLALWPFVFTLGWVDSWVPNRNGGFLLVLARARE